MNPTLSAGLDQAEVGVRLGVEGVEGVEEIRIKEPEVEEEGFPVSRLATQSPSAAVSCALLLWRQRRLLARTAAAGGLLTLLMALLIPNRYEATTRLMPPDMRGSGSGAMMAGMLSRASGGLADIGANLLGIDNTGAVFMGILQSRTVEENLVARFDLRKVYRDRLDQDARADLAERTVISEDRKSQIITITVEDRDPRRAARLAAAFVEELNRLLVVVNTSSAHRERVFIEERLQVIRPQLDLAAKRLSDFSTANTTLDPKEQGKAMVGAVVNLQGELIASQTELRGLQQIYSDQNVRVRSLQARIGELRHQLQELRGRGAEPVSGSGDATRSGSDNDNDNENENKNTKEAAAAQASAASYPSFRQLPSLGVAYADLYRELRLREVVFETLTQQYEMAKIAEAKEIPSVKVLDPAEPPERKSGPHRLALTLLGAGLSFTFGVALALARAGWGQVPADDPRKRFAAEVMAEVLAEVKENLGPAYSLQHTRMARLRTKLRRRDSATRSALEDGPQS